HLRLRISWRPHRGPVAVGVELALHVAALHGDRLGGRGGADVAGVRRRERPALAQLGRQRDHAVTPASAIGPAMIRTTVISSVYVQYHSGASVPPRRLRPGWRTGLNAVMRTSYWSPAKSVK